MVLCAFLVGKNSIKNNFPLKRLHMFVFCSNFAAYYLIFIKELYGKS